MVSVTQPKWRSEGNGVVSGGEITGTVNGFPRVRNRDVKMLHVH